MTDIREIAAFVKGPVAKYGSGALATEESWALRYSQDVSFLLGALSQLGVDTTPLQPVVVPQEPETYAWDEWEEMLGLTITDATTAFPEGEGEFDPLTREEFLRGYMTCVESGDVDARRPGHQSLMAEMKAIAMEGVPT